jgi:Fe-S oxidoreductase
MTYDITVRLFILPIKTWDQLPGTVLKNALRVFEDTGVSFVRNGREVYMGSLAAITGKMGSKDPE